MGGWFLLSVFKLPTWVNNVSCKLELPGILIVYLIFQKIIRFQNSSTYLEYSVEWPALNFWKNTRKTSTKGLFKRTYDCHPEKVTFYNVVQGKYYLKDNFRAVTFLAKFFTFTNCFLSPWIQDNHRRLVSLLISLLSLERIGFWEIN